MSKPSLLFLALVIVLANANFALGQTLSQAEARHILSRSTLRFSESEVGNLQRFGLKAFLRAQMEHPVWEPEVETYLNRLPHHQKRAKEIYMALLEEPGATEVIEGEMMVSRLIRGLQSKNQLREVMTDFWFNHFNADPSKGPVVACNVERLEQDLREHAFGSFRDILELAVKNPAVLENLDNTVSDGRAVNENFGREIMELYSTGPVHTQEEVVEMAKCFSGWSYDGDPESETFLEFRYYPEHHAPGRKLVFGRVFEEHSQEEVLDFIATHPDTAKFISRKLVVRFVNDEPPQALVEEATQSFLESGGEMGTVLTTIFCSAEFIEPRHQGAKLKTPLEFMVAALYQSGSRDDLLASLAAKGPTAQSLVAHLQQMGSPYSCPNPLGWPDSASTWLSGSGQRERWKVAQLLSRQKQDALVLIAPEFQRR